jgi:hypothetical protein
MNSCGRNLPGCLSAQQLFPRRNAIFLKFSAPCDGSVSQNELTSAMQASHAHHHHHHANRSQGADDIVQALMSGTQGASASTTSNSDGSRANWHR